MPELIQPFALPSAPTRQAARALPVLILGFSSIVARRVLPALASLASVAQIHIASRKFTSAEVVPSGKGGQVFSDYQGALAELKPGVVYISLPNSLHAPWIRRALNAGFHVIVDKPACTSLADIQELAALADRLGLCLAEATVWSWHPQFKALDQLLAQLGQTITRVSATFSFPPLPKDNFRNQAESGGGCLFDLGPYAASCARYFFADPPAELFGRILSRDPETGLDTAFSILATYSGGRALVGHFGWDTEYRNSLSLLGPAFSMEIDRAFTAPPDWVPKSAWRTRNQGQVLAGAPGDSFALFLDSVIDSIQRRNWQSFSRALLQDAQFLHQLRTSTGIIAL